MYADSLEAFKMIIKINPNDANAYKNIGHALHNLGRYEEAIEAFNCAIEIIPDDTEPYLGKANALASL